MIFTNTSTSAAFCISKTLFLRPLSDIKNVETEIWDFANNKTTSTMIDPFLPNGEFMYGLGLYLVPDDYCEKQ